MRLDCWPLCAFNGNTCPAEMLGRTDREGEWRWLTAPPMRRTGLLTSPLGSRSFSESLCAHAALQGGLGTGPPCPCCPGPRKGPSRSPGLEKGPPPCSLGLGEGPLSLCCPGLGTGPSYSSGLGKASPSPAALALPLGGLREDLVSSRAPLCCLGWSPLSAAQGCRSEPPSISPAGRQACPLGCGSQQHRLHFLPP